MATARPKPTARNSKRPKLNTGGTESNLNDLVNFQLPPRRQHFSGPRRSKKTGAGTPWAKERQSPFHLYTKRSTGSPNSTCLGFINSAYRFVLKPSVTADYTVHFVDPDMYVWLRFAHLFPGINLLISYFQWSDIVQILVPHAGSSATGEGNTMCPICLGAPIAPRMTKCGHVSLHLT